MDTLHHYPRHEPRIASHHAKVEEFVSIKEEKSIFGRLKGSFGRNIDWDNPPKHTHDFDTLGVTSLKRLQR